MSKSTTLIPALSFTLYPASGGHHFSFFSHFHGNKIHSFLVDLVCQMELVLVLVIPLGVISPWYIQIQVMGSILSFHFSVSPGRGQ